MPRMHEPGVTCIAGPVAGESVEEAPEVIMGAVLLGVRKASLRTFIRPKALINQYLAQARDLPLNTYTAHRLSPTHASLGDAESPDCLDIASSRIR